MTRLSPRGHCTAAFVALALVLLRALGATAACDSGAGQLFPLTVEVLDRGGTVLHPPSPSPSPSLSLSPSPPAPVCHGYPLANESLGPKFQAAWRGFTDLFTMQIILPYALAQGRGASAGGGPLIAAVRLSSTSQASFAALYANTTARTRNGTLTLPYPPPGAPAAGGDGLPTPAHITVVKTADGKALADRLMAVFVGFRGAEAARDCSRYGHCCFIDGDIPDLNPGSTSRGCSIGAPTWRCHAAGGGKWRDGLPLASIAYLAPLAANKSMADGRPVLLHLGDEADLSVPLSNSYANHPVVDGAACRSLCRTLHSSPELSDLTGNSDAAGCRLAGPPTFKAAAGYGPITISGFGRVNGQRMMQRFSFGGRPVWRDPGAGILNGYGAVVSGFETLADAQSHTRWRVMSGLVELSTAAAASAEFPYAIDIRQLSVAWGPKRGDGSVRLQFNRVPLDGNHSAGDSNRPVRMHDVKTPGTWVGASDGPRVTADGSSLRSLYLHHADDNLKLDSSLGVYSDITLLQGNIGSAIELGTYGIGIRGNRVSGVAAARIHVHRIAQYGAQDDGLGSLLGTRTCPWGITLEDIAVSDVHVMALDGANVFSSRWAAGTLGEPQARFAPISTLDRWFFCSNAWWRDGQSVRQQGRAVTMRNLTFSRWSGLDGANASFLYNFHVNATTSFSGLRFNGWSAPALDNVVGEHRLPQPPIAT